MSNHFRKFGIRRRRDPGLAKLILFQNCPLAAPRDHECYNESQPRQRIIPRRTSSATTLAHNQENSVSDNTLLMRFDETRISLCRYSLCPQLFETLLDVNKIRF